MTDRKPPDTPTSAPPEPERDETEAERATRHAWEHALSVPKAEPHPNERYDPPRTGATAAADRLRARLRRDPEASKRLRAALLDICDCGGSIRDNEHAPDCTDAPAELPGEDRSKPPPGYAVWEDESAHEPEVGLFGSAWWPGIVHPRGEHGTEGLAIAACWAHHDAHPAVAALTEARRERDDHEHARAEAEVQIQELFARLARLEQERDEARSEAEALRGLLERCVALLERRLSVPSMDTVDFRVDVGALLSEIIAATREMGRP